MSAIFTRNWLHRWLLPGVDEAVPDEACPPSGGRDRERVLAAAQAVEPDIGKAMHWFVSVPIRELGDKTARQLVDEGATAELLAMIAAIRSGRRGR
ncbi:hypothetical protein [Frateuria defendens]|uniref:hypothetical protein n=1 Tax=Frateuria defendens TaxID=2219559 RepID=UPI00066FD83E|nr:hypothetical protein [Frateuria defendens]